jgi:NAD(P)-dependent dehydrogenase (short-subunit alcohol dehydrogenase family)
MHSYATDEELARLRSANALGRPADLQEVARMTLFVGSPHASFVTGTTVDVTAAVL